MIYVESFNKSLTTIWIKKYLDKNNQGKWKLFFDLDLESFGGTAVLTGNLNTNDINKIYKINNGFIKEVLTFWTEVNFENQIISENQFLNQSLWHNSLIRVNNRPLFFPEWHNKGTTQVKNLTDDSNSYLSLTELQEKYSLISCPLKYYGLLSALKYLWNIHRNKCDTNSFKYESLSSRLMRASKTSPLVYNKLIEKKKHSFNTKSTEMEKRL